MDAQLDEFRPSKAVAAGLAHPKPRSPSSRRRRRESELTDAGIGVVAVLAAIGAALADCHPVDWVPADIILSAGFAAVVTVATSKARRWTWLVLAGVAGLTARSGETLALAAASVALAFVGAALADRRVRLLGALVGATAVQVLLRQGPFRFDGATALVAALAVMPALVSGYGMCHRRSQRLIRRAVLVTGAVVAVVVLGFGVAVLQARSQLVTAVADGQAGLNAVKAGDQAGAQRQLESAQRAFASADESFSSIIARPARALPIVGQQVRAARAMTASGADLMHAASVAATTARYEDLKTSNGQVNLPLLASMRRPVAETASSLDRADAQLAAVDSSWLVPPLGGPLRDLRSQVSDARPQAHLASEAVDVMPDLLGASGPKRYFLAFGTPAESRFLGGFIGSYGELTAVDGKLTLTRSGSIQEISNAPGADTRTLEGMALYLDRYNRYQPARYLQNDSASPDFPAVAEALRQLYPQAGGAPVDGVIYVDPYGLAALLKLTGPVTVEGLATPLNADNAADFLLRKQYTEFPDDTTNARSDLLSRAAKATFEALTSRQLAGPKTLAEALAPMVSQGRVMMTTFDDAGRAFLTRAGATGAFPRADARTDFVSLRTSNGGASKIDTFLHRRLDYHVAYAPDTGATTVTATVTFRNDAPAEGLPDYVIGNTPTAPGVPRQPKGTSLLDYSLYADADLQSVTADGAPIPIQSQSELGHHVYSGRVVLAPGASATLVFSLHGTVSAGTYRLAALPQPGVTPEQLTVTVDAGGWVPTAQDGWPPNATTVDGRPGAVTATTDLRERLDLFVAYGAN
jgi:hypothetical protein